jgi:hypothetical protein
MTMSRLGRIMGILGAERVGGTLLGSVCKTAVEAMSANGAGLTLLTRTHRGPICSHGEFAALGEELQFSLGEGPCGDAHAGGELIEVTDLSSGQGERWPMFSAAMTEAGVTSLASFPLRIGGARFGALTLYRSSFGELSFEQVADGYVVAQIASHLIVAGQAQIGEDSVIPEIEAGFVRMEPVHQATGMVMAQLGIEAEDALARLRGAAFGSGRTLLDMAMHIVLGRVELPRDG